MKKLHAPVGVPPSGLLASLRLLVRGLLPATTRRMGEEEGGGRGRRGKEGGREKGGREKEREREKREGSGTDRQAQLDHLGCLLASGVTTSSSLSAIWRATLYPPTRCLRMSHRVRLAALVGSFTAVSKSRCVRIANGNSHLVISSSWQYAATCRAVSRPSPHAQTGVIMFEQEGPESYLPCSHLDEEGAFRFLRSVMQFQPFFCRRFVCRFLSTASMPGP
jgi:hypothetical protein